jgi:hypothetical protein
VMGDGWFPRDPVSGYRFPDTEHRLPNTDYRSPDLLK